MQMELSPAQRHYILDCLPDSGSLDESILIADLRPRLAWSEDEAAQIPEGDTLTIYHLNEALEPKDVDLSDDERTIIAQGLVLMEAKRGDNRDLPSTKEFADLVRSFSEKIEEVRSPSTNESGD